MSQAAPVLGCSSISFRAMPLRDALRTIRDLGFGEIDLGAIPAVTDHVPIPLTAAHRADVSRTVRAGGLDVRVVNADPGPLSAPDLDEAELLGTVRQLSQLAAEFGAGLVVPCGAPSTELVASLAEDLDLLARRLVTCAEVASASGVRLLVEAPHHLRLCHTLDRSRALFERLDRRVAGVAGVVLDASHVVACGGDVAAWAREMGERTEHVQLRDAVAGNIHLSLGNGQVDFPGLIAALRDAGYAGGYSLELETHDIDDQDRPAATAAARDVVTTLLNR